MVTVEKVLNDIEKNQMAPVYLVLGEEQVNAEKIKQKLIANFPEEEREFNIGIFDMEEVTLRLFYFGIFFLGVVTDKTGPPLSILLPFFGLKATRIYKSTVLFDR